MMEVIEVAYVGGAEHAEDNLIVDVASTSAGGGTSCDAAGDGASGDNDDVGGVDGDGDGDGDGNDNDENLDDLLENLDIDGDFECWESMKKTPGDGNENEGGENGGRASSSDNVDAHAADETAGKSNKDSDSPIQRPPSPSTVLQQNLQKWKERLEREEVYSRLYRPSQSERLELAELETTLNMNPKRGLRTLFLVRTNSGGPRNGAPADRMAWYLLIHPEEQQQQQQQQPQQADAANANASSASPFPSSILLKRGPVSYGEDNNNEQSAGTMVEQGEAILLTRGLILSKTTTAETTSKRSVVTTSSHSSFHRAILWQNVAFVEPVAGDDMSWTLTIQKMINDKNDAGAGATTTTTTITQDGGSSDNDEHSTNNSTTNNSENHDDNNKSCHSEQQHLTFVCSSLVERGAWLEAMERVLIPYHLHNINNTNSRNNNHATTGTHMISITELGWQYKLVHRPAFTMAVTGMVADMVLPPPDVLNKLDQYNELTPLHYAVRLNMTTSIRRLLDAGADPNVKDADGRTCMYYAVKDELPSTTIDLLKEYGAKESQLAKMETKGELFGRVQATEQVRQDRRETQQRQEAVEAQVKMNENLRLLNERGEKIEDLGNKASELNENASNFASMAKQLKEKSKKQSKWLPWS